MNNEIAENIERIANHFDFDIRQSNKCYLGCCPIHGGDNPNALNFYHTGHTTIGNWQCKTQGCENTFGSNAIGFIRGLLSAQKNNWSPGCDQEVSFADAVAWCQNFLGITYESSGGNEVTNLINRIYSKQTVKYAFEITDERYRNSGLVFPDKYFLNRDYKPETLIEFGIGFCSNPQKSMYSRSVVPLHNSEGSKIIGCSGRSVWKKCETCSSYHNPKTICPTKEKIGIYSKWKHSKNFPGSTELYNFHRAKISIESSGIVLITEGQPNVWRLHEAGFPMSVSPLGCKFTEYQKKVLDTSGAHTIIVVPDNDSAGNQLIEKIDESCKHSYNIVIIKPSYEDDIGKCNIQTVQQILSPFVDKYKI